MDSSDYTPESFQKYLQTKDRTVLQPVQKAAGSPSVGTDREALALAQGYKSFGEAPPEVKNSINREVKSREDERLKLQRTVVNNQVGNTSFDNTARLRSEFQRQSGRYSNVRDMYGRVEASARNPSPAGDLSMIFAYMKILDPESVVRESEFRVAETARPLLEKAGLSWNRLSSVWEGKRLTADQRADFLNRARGIYKEQETAHQKTISETRRIAAAMGINPDHVVTDMTPASSTPAPASGNQPTMRYDPTTRKLEPIAQSRPRARNPKTNEVVEYDGKAWVPVKDPLGIR